jgi:hypothetical protein
MVIIPDETFYEMWINLDIDISKLEEIETKIGKFLATNLVASNILDKLNGKRKMNWQELLVWKTKLSIDNEAYREFVERFSGDWGATITEIETETESLLQVFQKLDAGISKVDASLLANARWIRSKSHYEPLILTDDSDLLASGHVLASFFGISLGCLSSFEALRLTRTDEPLSNCCKYFKIEGDFAGLDRSWSKKDLEINISKVLKKGKLACHFSKRILSLAKHQVPS